MNARTGAVVATPGFCCAARGPTTQSERMTVKIIDFISLLTSVPEKATPSGDHRYRAVPPLPFKQLSAFQV